MNENVPRPRLKIFSCSSHVPKHRAKELYLRVEFKVQIGHSMSSDRKREICRFLFRHANDNKCLMLDLSTLIQLQEG